MLAHHRIGTVFDVGANEGQFARSLHAAGYRGRIVSFEPLAEAHAELVRASKNYPSWDVAPRCALGDDEGEVEINIAANSVSSSLLPMHDHHSAAVPQSRFVGVERIRTVRLDAIAGEYAPPAAPLFVKIDTQGYEAHVLEGTAGILSRVQGLQLEMSFVTLYHGQPLFDDLLERLQTEGYTVWAIWPGLCDPETGRMLQTDVVLFRR
jgi:FkbM family methyltransferase